MSILIFFAILFVLVLVHELGHFLVAKKMGMRVDEFGIGFPPKLYGIKKGETEYTFNLFPIGGFVKIFGEDGLEQNDREVLGHEQQHSKRGSNDRERAFTSKNPWSQGAVLIAGVTMNVLFAWLLFTIALTIGVQTVINEYDAGANTQLVVTEVLPGSPASKAGLNDGIVVTSVAAESGAKLEKLSPSSFGSFVQSHPDELITLTYQKGSDNLVTTIRSKQGIIDGEPDRAAIGVVLAYVDVVSRPVPTALWEGLKLTGTNLKNITAALSKLFFDAVRFKADLSQVAGPVGIVGLVGQASAFGITSLLMFTAFISLNLAVINVLPFPALDGGRLLFVIIESIKGSPIHPRFVHALNMLGFVLLILLMIAITYHDIVRII